MTSAALNQYPQAMNFEQLYRDHLQVVRSIVKGFRFPDAAADDMIQEIFLKAWQSMHQIKVKEAFSGWLCTIAKNQCLNELRSVRREIPINTTNSREWDLGFVLEAPDPFSTQSIEQSHQYLETLINMHKDKHRRQIAILFYIDHRSVKEISELLDMNTNTVLSHLRRFRVVVKKALLEMAREQEWSLDI